MLSLIAPRSPALVNNNNNNNAIMSPSTMMTSVEPSSLQVDYDVNITDLYQAICNCDWDLAVESVRKSPEEARTWVVRHYADESEEEEEEKEIMWRFLPIHSACARDPPAYVISALLKAYPDGAHCVDDQGMYALHYACGNQASREVIRLLLVANSMAAKCADPRGMLPIHYLACWGPSSVSIIDMVMVANRDVGKAQDNDGNTPLDLAMEGDYPERNQVVVVLKRWLEKSSTRNGLMMSSAAAVAPATPPRTYTPTKMTTAMTTTTTSVNVPTPPPPAPPAVSAAAQEEEEEEAPVAAEAEEEHFVEEEIKDKELLQANDNDNVAAIVDNNEETLQEKTIEEEEEEETPQENNNNKEDPAADDLQSPRLAVNTHIDDQVEVNIMSSPLSQVHEEHENENTIAPRSGGGEEKESIGLSTIPSPRTVSRLRQEVTKLRMEKHQSDAEWEEKLKSSVQVLDNKCDEMIHQVEELKIALQEANTKITTLEKEAIAKDQIVVDTESQLSDALERIQGVEQEKEELQQDIGTLEEDNTKLIKEIESRNERLYSLTASIESMMERQELIMQAVNEKNAQLTEASQARRQNLKMLFDMEQEFMEAVMDDEMPEYEAQMREMESLTVMIAAMKDD